MRAVRGSRTFQSSAPLAARGLRVKLDPTTGQLVLAGALDRELGTNEEITYAAGELVAVVLPQTDATVYFIASEAIAARAPFYGAADGKVQATPNGNLLGIALEAAGEDGDSFEGVRLAAPGTVPVEDVTADRTLTAAESGRLYTTIGAAGPVVLTLPPATPGLAFSFRVGAAQDLRVLPAGVETIADPATGVQGGAGKYLAANADGETLAIASTKAGEWSAIGAVGTWTLEV